MACITFIAPPLEMATKQLARVVTYPAPAETTWIMDDIAECNLPANWVVTTDSKGIRVLRMQWTSAERPHD